MASAPLEDEPGSAIQDSRKHTPLPPELLERILEEAWTTLAPPPLENARARFDLGLATNRYRWSFYTAVTSAAHTIRALALELPYRLVIMRTTGDVELYRCVFGQRLADARRRSNDREKADAQHRALFMRTRVHLAYVGDFLASVTDLPGPHTMVVRAAWRKDHTPLVPTAKAVVFERWLATSELMSWLRALGRLEILRIVELVPTPAARTRCTAGLAMVPLLRLRGENTVTIDSVEVCGSSQAWSIIFAMVRPQYTRLVFLTRQSLRDVVPAFTHTLNTLVLDSPPDVNGATALSLWGIPSALAAGIFEAQARRGSSPRIIVRGAKQVEPIAWDAAWAACQEHGVALELETVY
jgi:hypothetical protein